MEATLVMMVLHDFVKSKNRDTDIKASTVRLEPPDLLAYISSSMVFGDAKISWFAYLGCLGMCLIFIRPRAVQSFP